jgi:hypothetical protein
MLLILLTGLTTLACIGSKTVEVITKVITISDISLDMYKEIVHRLSIQYPGVVKYTAKQVAPIVIQVFLESVDSISDTLFRSIVSHQGKEVYSVSPELIDVIVNDRTELIK